MNPDGSGYSKGLDLIRNHHTRAFLWPIPFFGVGVRPRRGLVERDSLDDGAALRVRPLRRGRQALRFRRLGRRRHRSASLFGSGFNWGSESGSRPVLRIHDILLWIRIRGSMPLTNGSGSGCGYGSCYFCHWPSRFQQKTKFFYLLLFEGTFTSFFRDKKSKLQNSRNQGFSYYFGLMIDGSGTIPLISGYRSESRVPNSIRIRIRIRIRNTGPGRQKWPQKRINEEMSWLDVLYALFGGLETFSVALKSFFVGLRIIIIKFFITKKWIFIRRKLYFIFGHQNPRSASPDLDSPNPWSGFKIQLKQKTGRSVVRWAGGKSHK